MDIEQELYHPKAVAKIFELRRGQGKTQDIVEQMFVDAYQSGVDDPELGYLGFRTLLERGNEGQAAIQWIARDTGELGKRALQLLATPHPSNDQVEKISGLKRYGEMIDWTSDPKQTARLMQNVYLAARESGMPEANLPFEVFQQRWINDMLAAIESNTTPPNSLMSLTMNFRTAEPAYHELIGIDETARLQAISKPRLVLLGASDLESVRGFDHYAHSINPTSQRRVLELNRELPARVQEKLPELGIKVNVGDALQMPYRDNAIDHLYTNALLHQLRGQDDGPVSEDRVGRLLHEAFRVLRPGGQLNMLEGGYGKYKTSDLEQDTLGAMAEVQRLAKQAGFTVGLIDQDYIRYLFRKDELNSQVSRNGVTYYPKALLSRVTNHFYRVRLEKPAA